MTRTAKGTPLRESARDRILRTATGLFSRYGIRGVGVDRIIAESGVAKATLYAHFRSKDELVLAYLRQADEKWRGQLREAAGAAGDDPREQLISMFDAISVGGDGGRFWGRAFVNSAGETLPGTAPHELTVEHKRAVRNWTTELAAAAGAPDAALLARQLTVLLDGAMAAATMEPSNAMVHAARVAARILVERACPAPPGSRAFL